MAADRETVGQIGVQRDTLVLVDHDLAVELDSTGEDQLLHLAPGAVTEVGEQPVQARGRNPAHRRAS